MASASTSAVHLLHRAAQLADGLFWQKVKSLTPRQFEVLKAVANSDGLSQVDIMAATGIDRSSVASHVAKLVRMGFLRRRRIRGDTRTYAVRLTPEGRAVLNETVGLADAVDKRLLATLSDRERTGLLRTLDRVVAANLTELEAQH